MPLPQSGIGPQVGGCWVPLLPASHPASLSPYSSPSMLFNPLPGGHGGCNHPWRDTLYDTLAMHLGQRYLSFSKF